HADAAVPVQGHEAEGRVDGFVDYGQVEAIAFCDRRPVVDTRAAKRIDAEADLADGVHVQDVAQIGGGFGHVVVLMRGGGADGALKGDSMHAVELVDEKIVGEVLDESGGLAVRGTAVGRVVLESAVFGRVVGRSYDDGVGECGLSAAVVVQDRVRDGR